MNTTATITETLAQTKARLVLEIMEARFLRACDTGTNEEVGRAEIHMIRAQPAPMEVTDEMVRRGCAAAADAFGLPDQRNVNEDCIRAIITAALSPEAADAGEGK